MGEIFQRPIAATPLPFTGERLTSNLRGQTEIEHLHRYLLARHFCRDMTVLDIASGEGYGSALIAQVASSVVGVDVAADAVAHANSSYAGPNLRFSVGDARSIPMDDSTIDVVVSFETIEHFDKQQDFLVEIFRVLKSDGLLLISTPDRDNYSPTGHGANPFHARELTRDEFVAALKVQFAHVSLWWQRALLGSVLFPGPEFEHGSESLCFEVRGESHFEQSTGYPRPQYLVACCSNAAVPRLPASVFIETGHLYAAEAELRAKLAAEQERIRAAEAVAYNEAQRAEAAEVRLRRSQEALEAAVHAAAAQQERCAVMEQRAQQQRAAGEQLEQELAAMRRSTSWQITRPLRLASSLFRGRAD